MARLPGRRPRAACIASLLFASLWSFTALLAAEKPATWVEIRAPHFTVYSDGGEKTARVIALQFEQMRATFLKILDGGRVDPGQPILILAAKDEKSLAALLPEYYQVKDRVHPAGLYVGGNEKIFISLRTDITGELPYQVIYHEYTHQLMHLNEAVMPTWIDEGYADFFGYSRISGRNTNIGYAPPWQMQALQRVRMLPLEELFNVDQKSPYYNESNKVNIFYQESWALVHFLFFDPEYRKAGALTTYLKLVNGGADSVEAGRQAFGDLKLLQKRLEMYTNAQGYYSADVTSPLDEIDKQFSARTISEAEADALLGGYSLARGRLDDARPLLEQAIKLDANSPAANESLGMLHWRLNETDQAETYFARAVQANSAGFLAYYFDGVYKMRQGAAGRAGAEEVLKKSIALNPVFAPARANLAQLYLQQPGRLDEALAAAQSAVSLDSSQWQSQIILAQVMAAQKNIVQARAIATRLAQSEPAAKDAAASLLDYLDKLDQYNRDVQAQQQTRAAVQPPVALTGPSGGPPAIRRRTEDPAGGADAKDPAPTAATAAASPSVPSTRVYSMAGNVASIDCTRDPEVSLTLVFGGITMKLHAADWTLVKLLGPDGAPQPRAINCAQLRSTRAQISYLLLPGGPYDGEITAIKPNP